MRFNSEGMSYELCDLTFSNGLELKGCEVYGNNYVTTEKLTASDLAGGLRRVSVKDVDTGEAREYSDMWLDCVREARGGVTVIEMRELSYYERQEKELEGKVEYLAMMSGVEL